MMQPVKLGDTQLVPDEGHFRKHFPEVFRIDDIVAAYLQELWRGATSVPTSSTDCAARCQQAEELLRSVPPIFDTKVSKSFLQSRTPSLAEHVQHGSVTVTLVNVEAVAQCLAPLLGQLLHAREVEQQLADVQHEVGHARGTVARLVAKRDEFASMLATLEDQVGQKARRLRQHIDHNDERIAEKRRIIARRQSEAEQLRAAVEGHHNFAAGDRRIETAKSELVRRLASPRCVVYRVPNCAAVGDTPQRGRKRSWSSMGYAALAVALGLGTLGVYQAVGRAKGFAANTDGSADLSRATVVHLYHGDEERDAAAKRLRDELLLSAMPFLDKHVSRRLWSALASSDSEDATQLVPTLMQVHVVLTTASVRQGVSAHIVDALASEPGFLMKRASTERARAVKLPAGFIGYAFTDKFLTFVRENFGDAHVEFVDQRGERLTIRDNTLFYPQSMCGPQPISDPILTLELKVPFMMSDTLREITYSIVSFALSCVDVPN